ncbi:MAG TPA: polysaccharide deacetylase family protein [Steroidobacteraceae bacterium]|nr:polysaccharide deacetylase family protein [Steroidobacteraceae bacterium]
MKTIPYAFLLLISFNVFAAGPESIAMSNRSLWPDPIKSPAGFDRASRAEILVFANALQDIGGQSEEDFKSTTRLKAVDMQSVARIRDRLLDTALANYMIASQSCTANEILCGAIHSRIDLISTGQSLLNTLPTRYKAWHDDASVFHKRYAAELLRLAALFPRITSEIDTFSSNERNGFELPDRHFQLTFDDGPSNAKGNSDTTLAVLKQQRLHALFFVLGERLQSRLQNEDAAALKQMYQGQCIALHGWKHVSHQHWDQWQQSVTDTQSLVKKTFGDLYRPYFRPPYGQRTADSASFFNANNLTVTLWNIDSQDWNAKVTADEAANRVMTLMLLWRRGLILFHDIHTKAQTAVPWLMTQTESAGITWDDCRHY